MLKNPYYDVVKITWGGSSIVFKADTKAECEKYVDDDIKKGMESMDGLSKKEKAEQYKWDRGFYSICYIDETPEEIYAKYAISWEV